MTAKIHRRHRPFSLSWLVLAAVALVASGCAPRLAPPPDLSTITPKYPDYVFPSAPAGLGSPATLERHRAGWQWLQAGDLGAADRNFAASLKLTPGFYPAEVGLGYGALARKERDEALLHFDRAIVANPRYAPALVGRGDALLGAGKRTEALQSFEAAVVADPALSALRGRIDVLRLSGLQEDVAAARAAAESGRLDDARKAYEQAITASPQSPFLYRELATVERRAQADEAALGHARRAVELDPSDARARVIIGEVLEARGDVNGAIEAYAAAVASEPDPVVVARLDALRARNAFDAMPVEFRAIATAPTITRAQLAALLGVRLEPLLATAGGTSAVVITDTRSSWAAQWILAVTRAGVMEVYANHTFQPTAAVARGDLARAASRVLALIGAEQPALAAGWRGSNRQRFTDVTPRHLSYPAASLAVEAGVMSAQPDGAFHLARPATGAEAVAAVDKLQALATGAGR